MSQTESSPFVEPAQFTEVRNAGKSMFLKVISAAAVPDTHSLRVAKRLGVRTAGKTIIFDDRMDQAALADYLVHEYRVGGKTLIMQADPVALQLTPLEAEHLRAAQQSHTSLYEIVEPRPQQCQLVVRDRLVPNPDEQVLTDVGLSQSFAHWSTRALLFLRLVQVQQITMTSGFVFAFPQESGPKMLQAFYQKTKKVTEDDWNENQFLFFFQMRRRYGLATRYME